MRELQTQCDLILKMISNHNKLTTNEKLRHVMFTSFLLGLQFGPVDSEDLMKWTHVIGRILDLPTNDLTGIRLTK